LSTVEGRTMNRRVEFAITANEKMKKMLKLKKNYKKVLKKQGFLLRSSLLCLNLNKHCKFAALNTDDARD
jgi:hypothetical protein